MQATTKDMRLYTRELLAATDRGEEVIITWRGQQRAKLTHCFEAPEATQQNPVFGIWQDVELSVDEQVQALRQGRSLL